MFVGDSQTATYTISVTKDSGTQKAYFSGQVCVINGGGISTENLAITVNLTMPPSDTVIASTPVSTTIHPVLAPGETYCYDYSVDVPPGQIVPGATYKVTANVTITNHSGHLGTPFGPNPSETANLPITETLVNDTIHVDDTNGSSFTFSASGSQTYTKSFCCSQPPSTSCQTTSTKAYSNTATIRETGQSDSATVTVNCYALTVAKTVTPSFTRNFCWAIDKRAVNPSNPNLTITNLTLSLGPPGQTFDVLYKMNVTSSTTDSNWTVSGTITVQNPAPIPAIISVTDLITPGNILIPVASNFTLAPFSQQTFNFSTPLPNGTSRTNQAKVTLQNSPGGTTDFFSNLAPFEFSQPTTFTNECVNVEDSYQGFLGMLCRVGAQFSYTRTIGPFDSCGSRVIANTASFTSTDIPNPPGTCASGLANWTINVNVPCAGCTHTIGFWKTHAGLGPQQDLVTGFLPITLGNSAGPKSVTVSTAEQAVSILSFEGSNGVFDASNGINKLYAQLLAAKLNTADGASGAAISNTLISADNFLSTNDSTDWSGLTKSQQQQVLSWAKTLENYNSGLIGPGHCSE